MTEAEIPLMDTTAPSFRTRSTPLNTRQNWNSVWQIVYTHQTLLKEKKNMHGYIHQLTSASAGNMSLNLNSRTFSKLTIKTVFKVL